MSNWRPQQAWQEYQRKCQHQWKVIDFFAKAISSMTFSSDTLLGCLHALCMVHHEWRLSWKHFKLTVEEGYYTFLGFVRIIAEMKFQFSINYFCDLYSCNNVSRWLKSMHASYELEHSYIIDPHLYHINKDIQTPIRLKTGSTYLNQ